MYPDAPLRRQRLVWVLFQTALHQLASMRQTGGTLTRVQAKEAEWRSRVKGTTRDADMLGGATAVICHHPGVWENTQREWHSWSLKRWSHGRRRRCFCSRWWRHYYNCSEAGGTRKWTGASFLFLACSLLEPLSFSPSSRQALLQSELGEVTEAAYKENHSGHGVPDGLHWGATGGMKTG